MADDDDDDQAVETPEQRAARERAEAEIERRSRAMTEAQQHRPGT